MYLLLQLLIHICIHRVLNNISMVNVMLDKTYVAQVRFGIRVQVRVRVRVRMRVRDSTIFEKGGCGCGGTRQLKNY